MIFSTKNKLFITVVMIGSIIIGCAGTPAQNPTNKTQREYQKIKNDTLVLYRAPKELKKARKAVKEYEQARASGQHKENSDQLEKLAHGRIAIARQAAELKATQDKMHRISKKLHVLRDSVRRIERKRMEAGLAKMPINQRRSYLRYFWSNQTARGVLLRFKKLNFNQEKAYLKSSDEAPINELAQFLNDYPNRQVLIEGYTDNTGAKSYNQKLSLQRAEAVRKALISRGVKTSRLQAMGLGEQNPIASNKSKIGRKRNRRVDIIVLSPAKQDTTAQ